MGFSRQLYWSGLPCSPPRDLPETWIEPASLMSPVLAGRFFTTSATWQAHVLPSPWQQFYFLSLAQELLLEKHHFLGQHGDYPVEDPGYMNYY